MLKNNNNDLYKSLNS